MASLARLRRVPAAQGATIRGPKRPLQSPDGNVVLRISQIEVAPEMIDAGAERLADLTGEVSTAYLVREVFLAMVRKMPCHPAI
jgi:hypothetical protein